jgi:hypothetical protein
MDRVVLAGRMPLERDTAEHSLEYRRAVAGRRLEKLTVPPPSISLVRARGFGFPPLRSASRSRSDSSWRCEVACATDAVHGCGNS